MSDFLAAIPLSALDDGALHAAEIGGRSILLARVGDAIHAASNVCPHAGSPLAAGRLIGAIVQCPLHGIRFRLADGSLVGNAVCKPLEIYPVRVRDGMVEVALPG